MKPAIYPFTIEDGKDVQITIDGQGVPNTPTTTTLVKLDASNNQPVADAYYEIFDATNAIVAHGFTNEDGELVIRGLIPGDYHWKESMAPDGFRTNSTVYYFHIDEYGTVTGDFVLKNEPTTWTITKTDAATGDFVPGATITIYDALDNEYDSAVTDEYGQITLNYIPVS